MFIPVQLFQTTLTALLTNVATTMKIPAAAASTLGTALGSGNYTIFSITNGVASEIIQCTGVSGTTATIIRGTEGSTAQTFATGSTVRFVWTTIGIQETSSGGTAGITIAGTHATAVTGGPFSFAVDTPFTTLAAGTGISVTGSYPAFTITNTSPGGGSATIVTGSGTAVVTTISGGYNVDVPSGGLTAGTGISITGAWPNFTITNSAPASGGSGTVTSVAAGTGITVTGTPTTAPIVGITPTGITPGAYGAITVNASGQVTAIANNLLTSVVSANNALTVSTSAGVATLTPVSATTSQLGVVQLAVASSSSSSNPADSTSAVTPAGIAAVIASQTPVTVSADTNNLPMASASYTNAILTSSLSLNLITGKTALVTAVVEVADTASSTNIPNFGIGLFSGATFIDGNSDNVPGAIRTLVVKIAGPFTGIVAIFTTALTGTFAVQSKSINIVTN